MEKPMKRIVTLVIVICAAAAVSLAADAKAGQATYDKSCKSCHLADGTGNPNIAKMMKVEMRPLGSAEVQAQSDDELRKIVTEGKGKMKPVASVTGKSVDDVIAYVRTLKK
jgi:cytochrome c5